MHPDFHLLLVHDGATNVKIVERALLEANIQHRLTAIRGGGQALESLQGFRDPADPHDREPDLILIDLDFHDIDGRRILTEIKNDGCLKAIPVVVLARLRRDKDFPSTDPSSAINSIQRPGEFAKYRDLVLTLRAHWHETSPRDRPCH